MGDKILFVCIGNSGRSQMAEAFFNNYSENKRAISAGTDPDKNIHPRTIKLMKEEEIDLTDKKPKSINEGMLDKAEEVIVMNTRVLKRLPSIPKRKLENWKIRSLNNKTYKKAERIKKKIKEKIKELLKRYS